MKKKYLSINFNLNLQGANTPAYSVKKNKFHNTDSMRYYFKRQVTIVKKFVVLAQAIVTSRSAEMSN